MDTESSGEEAPPSYDSVIHAGTSQETSGPESVTWHLQNHVTSLPARIRASQRARTARQKLDDTLLIDHIAPAIEEFLVDLGARGTAVVAPATLTIVPDNAVPENAELSGLAEMNRRGELGRVFRVNMDKGGGGGAKKADGAQYAFSTLSFTSSSSADLLWWQDEAMARRLADSLRPQAADTKQHRQEQQRQTGPKSPVQAAAEKELPSEKQKRSWGWGNWRSSRGGPQTAGERAAAIGSNASSFQERDVGSVPEAQAKRRDQVQDQEGARMIVEAQEVAFRVENDLGILESTRGWAIVVTVEV